MALDRKKHDPKFKDPASFTEQFKDEWRDEKTGSYKENLSALAGFSMIPAAILSLPFTILAPTYEGPERDQDLYTGIFNQTQNYSFRSTSRDATLFYGDVREGLLLVRNDEGFELYEVNENDSNRLMLVEDADEALIRMNIQLMSLEGLRDYFQERMPEMSPFDDDEIPLATCSVISAPFNYLGQSIERFQHDSASCMPTEGTPTENLESYNQNIALWEEAIEHMQDGGHYGPDPDAMTDAEFESKVMNYLEWVGLISLGIGGAITTVTVGSAAVNSRREKKKQSAPKPK